MKWDDRSTLFPDGSRLKAPVRSQHHHVCRAHACRETTGMTTDHCTRSPDTLPRAMASDPHVRARREGEVFLPPARHSRVFLSLARSNCARKPDSNQLLPKKGGTNNHGTTASVVPTAASAHGQVRHVAPSNSPTTSNSYLQTQNCAQCLPRDPRDVLRQHICHVIRTEHFQ